MKFWAIAYQFQEDVFYNVVADKDTMNLSEQCFLPSKTMTDMFIEDNLSEDYVSVEIELESLSRDGNWMWSRGQVERWDD